MTSPCIRGIVLENLKIECSFQIPSFPDTEIGRYSKSFYTLCWRHNNRDGVSNHQPRDCLLNRLFRRRSKKTSKLRVTGLCAGNSPGTGEFPAQMASYAENVSIWWRHNDGRQGPGVRDKHRVSEIDLSQPRHETAFWWHHNGPVTSQSTDPIKWPNCPLKLIRIYVHINTHSK